MNLRRFLPLLVLGAAWGAPAAETPEQFTERMQSASGVQTVLNTRQDGSFGSLSIGVQPAVVADRAAVEPVLADIGRFAAAAKLKADVLSPTQADAEFIAGRLTAAGVKEVATRVMAPGVSIRITRIFLTREAPAPDKPPARAEPAAEKPAPPPPKKK
jgi:hypothetical protein